jgi:hypothetical protein
VIVAAVAARRIENLAYKGDMGLIVVSGSTGRPVAPDDAQLTVNVVVHSAPRFRTMISAAGTLTP